MPEQEQSTGLGALFLEAMFKKYDDISSTIKTSAIPQFKKVVKTVALSLLVVFIGSLILVAMGTTSEVKILTVIGRLGLIFTGVICFFVATPIGYVLAGRKFVTFIRCFAIYQLFITLVIWISPMPVSASLLFGLSFAGSLLAFANILESNPGIVRFCTTVIFAGLLAATYFPSLRDKLDSQIIGMNEPSLIQISTGDLKAGKIKFFLKGQPKVWYLTTAEGTYELFDHSGYHDIYQKELQPITLEIVRKLINDEKLLSPRNLQRSSTTPAASAHATASTAQPPQKLMLSMSPYGDSARMNVEDGIGTIFTGKGFVLYCVYRDGTEDTGEPGHPCRSGAKKYEFVRDTSGQPNSVVYEFVRAQ